jgi:hypothetical protein
MAVGWRVIGESLAGHRRVIGEFSACGWHAPGGGLAISGDADGLKNPAFSLT